MTTHPGKPGKPGNPGKLLGLNILPGKPGNSYTFTKFQPGKPGKMECLNFSRCDRNSVFLENSDSWFLVYWNLFTQNNLYDAQKYYSMAYVVTFKPFKWS